jgi:anti-sigma B factor antagonist
MADPGNTEYGIFSVTVEHDGSNCIVRPVGELDVHTAPKLRLAIDDSIGTDGADGADASGGNAGVRTGHVVVDLTGLTFIDSSGLGALVRGHQNATAADLPFSIVCDGGPAQRLLDITGLVRVLTVHDSVEAAIDQQLP